MEPWRYLCGPLKGKIRRNQENCRSPGRIGMSTAQQPARSRVAVRRAKAGRATSPIAPPSPLRAENQEKGRKQGEPPSPSPRYRPAGQKSDKKGESRASPHRHRPAIAPQVRNPETGQQKNRASKARPVLEIISMQVPARRSYKNKDASELYRQIRRHNSQHHRRQHVGDAQFLAEDQIQADTEDQHRPD